MVLNRTRVATLLGLLLGASLTSTMVVRTTQAVFSGFNSTSNTWATGGAEITSDGTGTAVFNTATDGLLVNGQSMQKCIVVTYKGVTVPAAVRLYVSAISGTLPAYLDLTVETSTNTSSTNGNCTGFASPTTIWNGTLANFASAKNSFANGAGAWGPTVRDEKLTYRFSVSVQNVPQAQNQSASATFTWEAQTV